MKSQDITKQPEWVQQKIRVLEANIKYYKDMLLDQSLPDPMVSYSVGMDDSKGIPSAAQVLFKTKTGQITVGLRNGELKINGLAGELEIHPEAANAFSVITKRY